MFDNLKSIFSRLYSSVSEFCWKEEESELTDMKDKISLCYADATQQHFPVSHVVLFQPEEQKYRVFDVKNKAICKTTSYLFGRQKYEVFSRGFYLDESQKAYSQLDQETTARIDVPGDVLDKNLSSICLHANKSAQILWA